MGATERPRLNQDIRAEQHLEAPMKAIAAETSVRESSWVTPREAAAYLGVGVDTIYEACAAADLKHVKLGYRTIRLRREWIDLWAEKHATPAR
jgi:excisionase family DNA binding protein